MRHGQITASSRLKNRRFRYDGTRIDVDTLRWVSSWDDWVHGFWRWSFHTRSNVSKCLSNNTGRIPGEKLRTSQGHDVDMKPVKRLLRCHETELLYFSCVNKLPEKMMSCFGMQFGQVICSSKLCCIEHTPTHLQKDNQRKVEKSSFHPEVEKPTPVQVLVRLQHMTVGKH